MSLVESVSDVRVRGRRLPSTPPLLAPLLADVDPSRGGLVLYGETQDPQLIFRSAREVTAAFPDQPAFSPVSLFIATWLQVTSFDIDEVSKYLL